MEKKNICGLVSIIASKSNGVIASKSFGIIINSWYNSSHPNYLSSAVQVAHPSFHQWFCATSTPSPSPSVYILLGVFYQVFVMVSTYYISFPVYLLVSSKSTTISSQQLDTIIQSWQALKIPLDGIQKHLYAREIFYF